MGKMFNIDFGRGALVPLESPNLPLGQIVSYEDRANPRREYVIVADHVHELAHSQQQEAVCLEDGHRSQVSMAGGELCGNWRVEDKILSGPEMEQALAAAYANGAKLKAEAEALAAQKRQAAQVQREDWAKRYGFLERVSGSGYASAALGSKNLKRELARAFPGFKFSVTSDTYSGGCSIDVAWTLGPAEKEVEAIAKKYQQGWFNGMEDLYEYDHENQWPDIYGGAKHVFCNRHEGEGINVVALALCKEWNLTPPEDGRSFWNIRLKDDPYGHDVGNVARQIILNQSFPVGAVLTGIERTGETCGQWKDFFRVTFTAPQAAPVAASAMPAATVDGVTVSENAEKGGIEIRFPVKPAGNVLEALKSHGWRWSRFAGCWYHKADEATREWARQFVGTGGTAEPVNS